MKKIILILFTLLSIQSFSQSYDLSDIKGKEFHNKIRLNYIVVSAVLIAIATIVLLINYG